MKFSAVMALVGVVASKDLIRLNTYAPQYNPANQYAISDSVLVDATTQGQDPCVYLDESNAELEYQLDMFSRTLDPRHWTNV